MIFLNPAVLLGLFAASIPLLIHLLNLRKLKKVEFSTLAFLKEIQKSKIRKVRIKQWLLLIIRTLIIIFLVLAFARPTLRSTLFGGFSSTAKTTALIIIDNSVSMSAITPNGSLFNLAKKSAREVIKGLREGDEIIMMPTSHLNEQIFTTSDFSAAEKYIDELAFSGYTGDMAALLIESADLLSKSNNFNKELYIFSDFNSILPLEKDSIISDIQNEGANLHVYASKLGTDQINNIAITKFELNSAITAVNKSLSFSVEITNRGGTISEGNVLNLLINGERKARKSFDLQPGESVNTSLETNIDESGLYRIVANIDDDDIQADNSAYLLVNIPEKIRAYIWDTNNRDGFFIQAALNLKDLNNLEIKSGILAPANLNDLDVLIIIGSPDLSRTSGLREWIAAGNGLILMPGSVTDAGSFLNSLKFLDINAEVKNLVISGNSGTFSFRDPDSENPLLRDIFEGGSLKLDAPRIIQYFPIVPDKSAKKIIELTDGSAFMAESGIGLGKVIYFSLAPLTTWSDFPLKAFFAPLINRSVLYLSTMEQPASIIAGENMPVDISRIPSPLLNIKSPAIGETALNTDTLSGNKYMMFENTREPGFYSMTSIDKSVADFSVNLNPAESIIRENSERSIKEYISIQGIPEEVITYSENDNFSAAVNQSRFGTELWKIMLIIALLLIMAEMLLSRSTKNEIT